MSLIKLEKITAGYGKTNVLEDISFEVNNGELVGILGTNGSGKSTLAKSICNILSHQGQVNIDGEIIEKLKPRSIAKLIGYIPQHSGISIDISVLDVVLMGFNPKLKLLENYSREMREKASRMVGLVGLADKIDTNYMLLSEGQKQLVVLARALVCEGKCLIMDEPESALDFSVRYKMMGIIRKWITEGDRAGLVILHDTMLALNNCDRVILLKDKKISGIIDTKKDTLETIEKELKKVYGNINLVKAKSRSGKESWTMVCDSEEV